MEPLGTSQLQFEAQNQLMLLRWWSCAARCIHIIIALAETSLLLKLDAQETLFGPSSWNFMRKEFLFILLLAQPKSILHCKVCYGSAIFTLCFLKCQRPPRRAFVVTTSIASILHHRAAFGLLTALSPISRLKLLYSLHKEQHRMAI
jgi:hypothetical protein